MDLLAFLVERLAASKYSVIFTADSSKPLMNVAACKLRYSDVKATHPLRYWTHLFLEQLADVGSLPSCFIFAGDQSDVFGSLKELSLSKNWDNEFKLFNDTVLSPRTLILQVRPHQFPPVHHTKSPFVKQKKAKESSTWSICFLYVETQRKSQ